MAISDDQIQAIIDNPKLTNNKKFDEVTALFMEEGFTVIVRTDNQLQLIKKKKFSFIWALLWLLLFGVGIVIYLIYYLSKKDKQINITLPDETIEKKSDKLSTVDEIAKLSELMEKGHITKDEFEIQKQKIFSR